MPITATECPEDICALQRGEEKKKKALIAVLIINILITPFPT